MKRPVFLLHIIPSNSSFVTNSIYAVLLYSLTFPACFDLNQPSSGRLEHREKWDYFDIKYTLSLNM
jgi:hypothetical protein